MDSLYVIDASGFLYRSYFAIRGMTNDRGESTNALYGFIRSVLKLKKDFDPKNLVAVFDGPNCGKARREMYSAYKAHRVAMPQDLRYQIDWAREFCDLYGIPQLNLPDVEADDTMGTIARWAEIEGSKIFLCTSDKDMAQLVTDKVSILNTHKENLLLDPKGVEETYGVPPAKIIDYLAIVGDASDNVPGLTGFGPKTAVDLLQKYDSLDNILNNPDLVSGKKRDTVINEREKVLLSRKLVTVQTDVNIPHDLSFYQLRTPQFPQLREFYQEKKFSSLIKELEGIDTTKAPEKPVNYHLVDDEASFATLLELLSKQEEICFDTETTHERPLLAELVGIGFGFQPQEAWYVPVNGKLGLQRVLKGVQSLFANPNIRFYGHNVKYDLHVLENCHLSVAKVGFDTIIASYLLNSHNRRHSLDTLALELFEKVKIPITDLIGKGKKTITMAEVPIEKVCEYCCEDVDYTVRLKQVLEPQLKERHLTNLYYDLELPLMRVLQQMERRGIFMDTTKLDELGKVIKSEIETVEKEIYALAGEEFNLNSPLQMGNILFDKLQIPLPPRTKRSTNVEVLEELALDYPIAKFIIEYRQLEKLRSTYIETLPTEVNPKTHRIHSTFNQSIAATGRLSCQDPNLQNIPIRTETGKKIREAFRPQKTGWSYLAADYSQIELRLLAHLSGDPTLIQAFKDGVDIHQYTAAQVMEIDPSQVTSEERYKAKAVNFGILYGQGPYGLSKQLGITQKEASRFIDMYFKRYSHIKEFLEHCKDLARVHGKAVTQLGRERLIPEILSKNVMIRQAAERLAINTPIQGTAADLIKLAMLKIDQELSKKKLSSYMILQIHDELIFEAPDEELKPLENLVRECMQTCMELKVPLVVDVSIGKNWKEC
jgi:DNA polymerase-1